MLRLKIGQHGTGVWRLSKLLKIHVGRSHSTSDKFLFFQTSEVVVTNIANGKDAI